MKLSRCRKDCIGYSLIPPRLRVVMTRGRLPMPGLLRPPQPIIPHRTLECRQSFPIGSCRFTRSPRIPHRCRQDILFETSNVFQFPSLAQYAGMTLAFPVSGKRSGREDIHYPIDIGRGSRIPRVIQRSRKFSFLSWIHEHERVFPDYYR